mgnify:CR=1 FL=1
MLQDIQQGDAFIFVSRFDNTSLDTSINHEGSRNAEVALGVVQQ